VGRCVLGLRHGESGQRLGAAAYTENIGIQVGAGETEIGVFQLNAMVHFGVHSGKNGELGGWGGLCLYFGQRFIVKWRELAIRLAGAVLQCAGFNQVIIAVCFTVKLLGQIGSAFYGEGGIVAVEKHGFDVQLGNQVAHNVGGVAVETMASGAVFLELSVQVVECLYHKLDGIGGFVFVFVGYLCGGEYENGIEFGTLAGCCGKSYVVNNSEIAMEHKESGHIHFICIFVSSIFAF